ncbi:MAG TPA: hypothetical protein VGK24_14810 [Candidatus Angelobacter sp.]|jgi:hypothetical protein
MAPEIELLNAIATHPYAACEPQWKELLRSMNLGVAYIPVIQATIKEGRWKKQRDPVAYIRKSAMLSAARMGVVDRRPKQSREVLASDLQYKDTDGEPLTHDDQLGTALHNYEQENGPGTSAIYEQDFIGNRIADSLLDDNLEVDWDSAIRLAGMDAGERIVLALLRNGMGRDSALAACFSEDDRKLLQAAWKRFDRNKESLQYVLISGKAAPARRTQQTGDEPQLELIFIKVPGGRLKISFRMGKWK